MAPPTQVDVSVTTSSVPMSDAPPPPSAQLPQITLNGTPIPPVTSYLPNGIQVVVFESFGDLTNPASIISNKANVVWPDPSNRGWYTTYRYAWDNVANQLMSSGNPEEQIVIVATFGLDIGMFPTPAILEQLLARGAGPQLQTWTSTPEPSESGQYIQFPANYVLIGNSQYGYAQGFDGFDAAGDGQPVKTTVTATLDNA
jgi:hypothetical protein